MGEIMLKLTDVSKTYGEGEAAVHALKKVNLEIEKKEFAAVIGPSGSGKSTLLNICGGLDSPTSGSVFIRGTDISGLPDEKATVFRRENIGFVFQNYNLLPILTVYENIVLPIEIGGKDVDTVYVEEIMIALGLDTLKDRIPSKLSGGQQQRVAIASALAMDTEYLVLDEPTSGQDGREKKRLMALMERLQQKGITIILVTHDMDIVARDCTRVVVIAGHKVVFDDKPEILFSEANRPEDWGLAYPPAVLLGRRLPGAPYCRDMDSFCKEFMKRKGGASL